MDEKSAETSKTRGNITTLDMQRRYTGGDVAAKVQLQFKENYFRLLGPNTAEQQRE